VTATLSRQDRWWLAGVLALAAVLRLVRLGEGLWFDEIDTLVHHARLPLLEVIRTFESQNQHMLYSVGAHLSLALFGDGAAALRLPAALFGVASIAATAWLGARVAARREGLLAATLLTASYHHVWFSQNARGYTLLLLLVLLATGLFARLLEPGAASWRLVLAYAAVSALALYTHVTAAVVPAAHGVVWLAVAAGPRRAAPGRFRPGIALAAAAAFAALLYAPVLPRLVATVAAPTMPGAETEWRSPLWLLGETARGLARGMPGGWAALVAGGVVVVAGVVSYARTAPRTLALLLLPPALMAAALAVASHNLWPRFFFFGAGFAALIVVRGVTALAGRAWPARAPRGASALLLGAAALSLLTVPRAWGPKQDYAAARAAVERARAPGDAVVVTDMTIYPYIDWLRTGWTPVPDADSLAAVEAAHGRTWIVYTYPGRLAAAHPALWRRMAEGYRVTSRWGGTLAGGDVIVAVKP
jgi:4-amino-4-deoxy-L-arabinose transferase-like glycosyltransferase